LFPTQRDALQRGAGGCLLGGGGGVLVNFVFVDSFSNPLSRGHTNKTWENGILLFYVLVQNKTDVRGHLVYLFTIIYILAML
jgi:hypothetical protein